MRSPFRRQSRSTGLGIDRGVGCGQPSRRPVLAPVRVNLLGDFGGQQVGNAFHRAPRVNSDGPHLHSTSAPVVQRDHLDPASDLLPETDKPGRRETAVTLTARNGAGLGSTSGCHLLSEGRVWPASPLWKLIDRRNSRKGAMSPQRQCGGVACVTSPIYITSLILNGLQSGDLGFEPRLTDPESVVLPLHQSPRDFDRSIIVTGTLLAYLES